jgi:hypothetical protein
MSIEDLIEAHVHTGEGFRPLVFFNSWRVATLNYIDEIDPARIDRLERHLETDEIFVLLHGRGILFLAGGEEDVDEFHIQVMEPGIVYNVKQRSWHTVVLSRDASVLIVENADTNEQNSQYLRLGSRYRQIILETARCEQPGIWE